jgi:hypothetical protein
MGCYNGALSPPRTALSPPRTARPTPPLTSATTVGSPPWIQTAPALSARSDHEEEDGVIGPGHGGMGRTCSRRRVEFLI